MTQLQNMKFRISSPEQSKLLQEILLNAGYRWFGHNRVDYINEPYVIAQSDG